MDKLFKSSSEKEQVSILNEIQQANTKKNALTGASAVILNCFLFVNDPSSNIAMVSLSDRYKAIEYFGLGKVADLQNKTYGEQIIETRKSILALKDILGVSTTSWGLSKFFYFEPMRILWKKAEEEEIIEKEESFLSVSLEKDLRDYVAKNPQIIEKGLKLIQKEYPVGDWKIDVLCEDERGNLVVIETKKGRDGDKVFGQISRYLGFLQEKEGKKVKGIIVIGEHDEKLDYAVLTNKNVKIKYYRAKFDISDEPFVI